ncbi:ribonuclease P protein component [Pelagibacteraceae bacterium]|nr:ribonuclease P protein component [Pelagibacteraceae bacterium]
MAPELFTIKKRATFVHIRDNGVFIRSKNLNVQKLINQDLNNKIGVGFTATKRIGNAVKRNKAKRIMRELAKKILIKCKTNTYYVLIAKTSIFDIKFKDLLEELDKIINVK